MGVRPAEDLSRYAYRKYPLHKLYPDLADVPEAFLMDWFKDRYDYQRLHTSEELRDMMALPRGTVLQWLEDAVELVWAAKRRQWEERRRQRASAADRPLT